MRKFLFACVLGLLWVLGTRTAGAQFVAVGGGTNFSRDFSAPPPAGTVANSAAAHFSNAAALSIDGGVGVLPMLTAGIHYGFSKPELSLRRADALGSTAVIQLGSHTITFDVALRTPSVSGMRLYGLLGAGFSRFHLDVTRQTGVPFTTGPPNDVIAPVGSFGVGIEHPLVPFVRTKAEVRDDLIPLPHTFFQNGAVWHRVQFVAGIVIGR